MQDGDLSVLLQKLTCFGKISQLINHHHSIPLGGGKLDPFCNIYHGLKNFDTVFPSELKGSSELPSPPHPNPSGHILSFSAFFPPKTLQISDTYPQMLMCEREEQTVHLPGSKNRQRHSKVLMWACSIMVEGYRVLAARRGQKQFISREVLSFPGEERLSLNDDLLGKANCLQERYASVSPTHLPHEED